MPERPRRLERGFTAGNVLRVLGAGLSPQAFQATQARIMQQDRFDEAALVREEEAAAEVEARQLGFLQQLGQRIIETGGANTPAQQDFIAKIGPEAWARAGIDTRLFEPGIVPVTPKQSNVPLINMQRERNRIEAQLATETDPASQERLQRDLDEIQGLVTAESEPELRTQVLDLGNRKVLVDQSGNELKTFRKGLAPTRGGTGTASTTANVRNPDGTITTHFRSSPAFREAIEGGAVEISKTGGGKGIRFTTASGETIEIGGDAVSSDPRTPTRPVETMLQKDLLAAQDRRFALERTLASFKPEYLEIPAEVWRKGLKGLDKLGVPLPASEEAKLTGAARFFRNAISELNAYIKDMTGAAMGEQEATRLRKAVADAENDSPATFLSKIQDTRAELRMIELRTWRRLVKGIEGPTEDADGRMLAPEASEIRAELNEAAGVIYQQALDQMTREATPQELAKMRRDARNQAAREVFHADDQMLKNLGWL